MTMNFYIDDKKRLQKELLRMNAKIKDLNFYRNHSFKDSSGKIVDLVDSHPEFKLLKEKSKETLVVMEYYLQEWETPEKDINLYISSYPFAEIITISGEQDKVHEVAENFKNLKPAPTSKWNLFEEFCKYTGSVSQKELLFKNYN